MLSEWLRHFERFAFGYELAVLDGDVIGICGARRDVWMGVDVLNLYWRLLPGVWGRGLAEPLARLALEIAAAARRDETIVARMLVQNAASARVAERAGLIRQSELDGDAHGASWIVYAGP